MSGFFALWGVDVLIPEKNQAEPTRRGPGGRRPGAGRPKGTRDYKIVAIEVEARKHTEAALKTLIDIASKGRSEATRVTAAIALLDRGYGKPRQAVEHTGANGEDLAITVTRQVTQPTNRIAHQLNGNGANGHP